MYVGRPISTASDLAKIYVAFQYSNLDQRANRADNGFTQHCSLNSSQVKLKVAKCHISGRYAKIAIADNQNSSFGFHLSAALCDPYLLYLKRRVQQKRHRTPPDKTPGLSFDTAMFPHEYKILHEKSSWANKMNRKREKKYVQLVRPAGLKTRRSFSYTIITKLSCFWLCCCSVHNAK
jgi:hypothetical protein